MADNKKPNLFTFGTKELTQDAFLAWFISWADPIHHQNDRLLHATATEFLKLIFKKHNKELPEITSVQVDVQMKHMDVYVVINSEYHIIIEGKTFSATNDDQLSSYSYALTSQEGIDAEKVLPVFYKIRDESDAKTRESIYPTIERKDMLQILQQGKSEGIANEIFLQYLDYVEAIDNEVEAFRTLTPADWKTPQWKGFYKMVNDWFLDGSWDYVANSSGGFMGFWWNRYEVDGYDIYLQLEEYRLSFKLKSHSGEAVEKEKKWEWIKRIQKAASESGLPISKPTKMEHGKHVTFAVLDADADTWILTNDEGKAELDKSIERLVGVKEILDGAIARYKK